MAEIFRMDETTWRMEDDFVRFFLLVGTECAALIDSGVNSPNAKEMARSLTDLPILLINTHGDGDHTSGTDAFDEIHIGEEDYVNLNMAEKYSHARLVPLKDGESIDLGDRPLEMIAIAGHTKGSVAILDKKHRRLFAGDSVQDGVIFMFGPHRAPKMYESALNKLLNHSERFDEIIGSHGTPVLPKDYVSRVLDSWQQVQAGIASYRETEVHGTVVREYTTEPCGFYCEK